MSTNTKHSAKGAHTPGPWVVAGSMPLYIENEKGMKLARPIANGTMTADTYRANAQLIKAAPQMLGTLRECIDLISGSPSPEAIETALATMHAAIAAATGEAQ